MARRLIGTGTTDSNGRVTIPYTGTGAGKLQIVAECGSLLSETYEIYDYLFFEEATSSNHRTDWSTNGISYDYASDGTIISETEGSSKNYSANFTAIEDVIIEFDVIGITLAANGVRFYYKGADTTINSYISDLQPHHFKLVCTDGTVTTHVDDVEKTSKSTTTNTNCRFILNNSSIKFSNFKIYNI